MMEPLFLFLLPEGWNGILLLILGCSVVGCTVFVERIWQLRQAEIDTEEFLIALREKIREGNLIDAIQVCEEMGGAVARMIKAGLTRHEKSQHQIEQAMEISGMVEIAQLEKNAKVLSLLAHIAPLIGLLGTVLGFIQAFSEMRMSGLVDISATRIGEAMEYALITTAAGLAVAIPATLAYNYLVARVEGFVLEMQTTSAEVVDLLLSREERGASR